MVQIDRTALEAQGFEGAVVCAHAARFSTESSTSCASVQPALSGVGPVGYQGSVRRLSIGFAYENLQDPRRFAVLFSRHGHGALPKSEGTIT